jgi:hypothetical protein
LLVRAISLRLSGDLIRFGKEKRDREKREKREEKKKGVEQRKKDVIEGERTARGMRKEEEDVLFLSLPSPLCYLFLSLISSLCLL